MNTEPYLTAFSDNSRYQFNTPIIRLSFLKTIHIELTDNINAINDNNDLIALSNSVNDMNEKPHK